MGDVAKTIFALAGCAVVALLGIAGMGPATPRQPYQVPEIILTVLSPRDEEQIERLRVQGRYTEAADVFLKAIQVGPNTPKLGEACRREFAGDGFMVLECMRRMVQRRHYDDERAKLDRAYRTSY